MVMLGNVHTTLSHADEQVEHIRNLIKLYNDRGNMTVDEAKQLEYLSEQLRVSTIGNLVPRYQRMSAGSDMSDFITKVRKKLGSYILVSDTDFPVATAKLEEIIEVNAMIGSSDGTDVPADFVMKYYGRTYRLFGDLIKIIAQYQEELYLV